MRRPYEWDWIRPVLWMLLFIWIVLDFSLMEKLLSPWLIGKNTFLERVPLHVLALQHVGIVALSSIPSLVIGLGCGLFGQLDAGRSFRPLMLNLASIGETFPTAAVLALAVPVLGYGWKPTLTALILYGILPILRNTTIGLESISLEIMQAAAGMGMSRSQILFRVQLPLAVPVILAGIRTSVIINVSAATIGATVGAGGLGAPIISGIRSFDPLLILQGAVPVALLAIALDSAFRVTERNFARHLELS